MPRILERVWLTVDEASQRTGIGKTDIYEALRSRKLPGSQNGKGGSWRVHMDDLDQWMRDGRRVA